MADRAITDVFPNCVAVAGQTAADQIAFDLADLPGLTNSDLVPATGDWPTLLLALVNAAYTAVVSMADADAPQAITISRSQQVMTSGTWDGKQLTQITIRAYTDVSPTLPVVAEPT